ncbi:MAG: hypothetical protein F6J87_03280 [Spirulina sp. SIO3F2]|nr:hypothetical protein [Spirulina sp. SIO3F2]
MMKHELLSQKRRSLSKFCTALITFGIVFGIVTTKDHHDRFHFSEVRWDGITYKVKLVGKPYGTLVFTREGRQRPEFRLGKDLGRPYGFIYDLDRDGNKEVFYRFYGGEGFVDYNRGSDSLEFIELQDSVEQRNSVAPAMSDWRFGDLDSGSIFSFFLTFVMILSGLIGLAYLSWSHEQAMGSFNMWKS